MIINDYHEQLYAYKLYNEEEKDKFFKRHNLPTLSEKMGNWNR